MSNTQAPSIPMFVTLQDTQGKPVLVDIANIGIITTIDNVQHVLFQRTITYHRPLHGEDEMCGFTTYMSIEEIRDAIIEAQSRSLQMMTEIELQASIRATRAARQSVPR